MDASHTPRARLALLDAFLAAHPQVQFLACRAVDYSNCQMCKCLPVRRARTLLLDECEKDPGKRDTVGEREIGRREGKAVINAPGPMMYGSTRYGNLLPVFLDRFEESGWVPDFSTLRVNAGDDAVADIMVWVKSEYDLQNFNDLFASCCRSLLSRVEFKARRDHDLTLKVGWEIEFILMEDRTANRSVGVAQTYYAMEATREPGWRVVQDTVCHLERNGIKVWAYHPEIGPREPGQYEISLEPLSPMESADAVSYSMSVIKDIARKHGFFATLHPNPVEGGLRNGQHVHLSLSEPTNSDRFLAGILNRLPQTTAFLLGGYDSYDPGRAFYYGGRDVFWSDEKLTPVRKVEDPVRIEVRLPDAMTSPHLQLAALIVTGLEGLRENMPVPPRRTAEILKEMPQEVKLLEGIQDLPKTLEEAVKRIEGQGDWWKAELGGYCLEGYLAIRKAEVEHGEKMSYEERRQKIFDSV